MLNKCLFSTLFSNVICVFEEARLTNNVSRRWHETRNNPMKQINHLCLKRVRQFFAEVASQDESYDLFCFIVSFSDSTSRGLISSFLCVLCPFCWTQRLQRRRKRAKFFKTVVPNSFKIYFYVASFVSLFSFLMSPDSYQDTASLVILFILCWTPTGFFYNLRFSATHIGSLRDLYHLLSIINCLLPIAHRLLVFISATTFLVSFGYIVI